ncbi:BnaC01g23460D [Brassica napus]|uniref:S-acyltransferase n=1 Tax=Brassica napus TaxID=3708 RepID=A0A078FT76_BRANA|nr:BnaC01g23460D [Brassica napus]
MLNSSRKLGYIHGSTHMSSYFFLFSVTLLQYFVTCGSSPGYVIDAMRDVDETNAILYRYAPTTSFKNCLRCQKMVLDLYPPGTSLRNLTCGYCHVEQPPPAKHCHDCDRFVLQFDHHCVWLGTCLDCNLSFVLWYICEESALCIWTLIMYIDYLTNVAKPWWKNAVIILLLVLLVISLIFVLLLLLFHRSNLILTNQSTYELVRRKRIPYRRNMPERVHPFSRGIKRNLYNVCCGNDTLDSLPTAYELEDKSRSYTCLDMLKCRCC